MNYKVKNPVIIFLFNRHDHAVKVITQLRKVAPKKVYVVADGPRQHIDGENERCQKVREIVEKEIDWECEIIKNYADHNMGCGLRLSSGIKWGFEKEEKLIILEDDVFCTINFFRYCDFYLDCAEPQKNIFMISGCNLIQDYSQNYSDFFLSKFGGIWGWASWRDRFKDYDFCVDSNSVDSLKILDSTEKEYWRYYLNRIYLKKLNTWDYQWDILRYRNEGLIIVPKKNLTSNIGFDSDSTHTFTLDKSYETFGLWEDKLEFLEVEKLKREEEYENWYFRIKLHNSILKYFKIILRNFFTQAQKSFQKFSI